MRYNSKKLDETTLKLARKYWAEWGKGSMPRFCAPMKGHHKVFVEGDSLFWEGPESAADELVAALFGKENTTEQRVGLAASILDAIFRVEWEGMDYYDKAVKLSSIVEDIAGDPYEANTWAAMMNSHLLKVWVAHPRFDASWRDVMHLGILDAIEASPVEVMGWKEFSVKVNDVVHFYLASGLMKLPKKFYNTPKDTQK